MKIKHKIQKWSKLSADLALITISEEQTPDALNGLARMLGAGLVDAALDFGGRKGDAFLFYPASGKIRRVLLMGLGKAEQVNAEVMRREMVSAAKMIQKTKSVSVILSLPASSLSPSDTAQALIEGLTLALYQFDRYKTQEEARAHVVESVSIQSETADPSIEAGANRGLVIAEAVCRARDLVNLSPHEKTPALLADEVEKDARKFGFSLDVWKKSRIQEAGFGGLLAVNRGSQDPPRFMILEWKPKYAQNEKPIVLVGKGVVFDTGGLSLKPTKDSMDHMKCDMAGAAAVIGTFQVLARLNTPLHVIGLIPATDNRPGETAFVPGDVVTMHNGMTVEVLNTDAEGRMLLGDALSWAKTYNPELVVDIATLTGAQVVALGGFVAGIMTNEDDGALARTEAFQRAGQVSGDRVHPLPMFADYAELLKSHVADLKNIGGPAAGTITAAKFLEHFTDYPWVHVDMAGPAWTSSPRHYHPAGGTGFGVRLFSAFLLDRVAPASAENPAAV